MGTCAEANPKEQHTPGHVDCPACERTHRAMQSSIGEKVFQTAATEWLDSRKKLGQKSRAIYANYIEALAEFFGQLRVKEIHAGHLREYQKIRQQQVRQSKQHAAYLRGKRGENPSDGASLINHEINCVMKPLLRQSGRWEQIANFYEPLPLPKNSIGIAMTAEEEAHLFRVASTRKKWLIAYCCDQLCRYTACSPGEIRNLRVKHIDLAASTITVEEGVKNEFRKRTLYLNNDAWKAMAVLADRYYMTLKRFNLQPDPEHAAIFGRAKGRGVCPDLYTPIGSWKKAHEAIRKEAAKKFPRLLHLRRYDMRHTAATNLLQNPEVPYNAIEHQMGHRIGSKTKRLYDHIRDETIKRASDALGATRDYAPVPETPRQAEQARNVVPIARKFEVVNGRSEDTQHRWAWE